MAPNTTLSDSQRAQFSELLRRDPPHNSLMTQPLRDLPVYRWQSTPTPIGPRGKKGRVGDPVWPDRGGVAAPNTSENSWPAGPSQHGGGSPATDGLDTDPNPILLLLPHGIAQWHCGGAHSR